MLIDLKSDKLVISFSEAAGWVATGPAETQSNIIGVVVVAPQTLLTYGQPNLRLGSKRCDACRR